VKKRRNKYSSRQRASQTLKARQQQLFRECTWKKQHALEKVRRDHSMKFIHLPGRNSCDKGREDHFLQRTPHCLYIKIMEGTKINLKKLYTRSDERTHRRRRRLFLSCCSTCSVELTVVPYLPVAIKHIPLKNASPPPQHHRIMRRTPADFSRRQPAPLACPTDCIPTQHTQLAITASLVEMALQCKANTKN